MEWIADPQAWIALGALTVLEIVLGIDNIVFISILSNKLPQKQRPLARRLGLGLALGGRVVLLLAIGWIMTLTQPLLSVFEHAVSGRDLILLTGGLFLIGKATYEIHEKLEHDDAGHDSGATVASFGAVVTQIFLLDVVFSLDSVITAVGMADDVEVMIIAVTIAIGIMMLTARSVSDFIEDHPTVKMLALSFLLLIGVTLVAEGAGNHIPKGYIYSAMGFSLIVELLNLRAERTDEDEHKPVKLHKPRLRRAVERVLKRSE